MFYGVHAHKLDSKNRLILPAKFREGLGDTFMITKGLDGCLSVYTQQQFDTLMENLMKLPSTKKEARLYVRAIASKATECSVDPQGRIQLPAYLIQEGGLEKEVMIVGAGSSIEIWSKDRWLAYDQEADEKFEDVAESISDIMMGVCHE